MSIVSVWNKCTKTTKLSEIDRTKIIETAEKWLKIDQINQMAENWQILRTKSANFSKKPEKNGQKWRQFG